MVCYGRQNNAAINSPAIVSASDRERKQGLREGMSAVGLTSTSEFWTAANSLIARVLSALESRLGCSKVEPGEMSWISESAEASAAPAWPPAPAAPAGAAMPDGEHQAAADRARSQPPSTRAIPPPARSHSQHSSSSPSCAMPESLPEEEPSAVEQDYLIAPAEPRTQWRAWWRCGLSGAATEPADWKRIPPTRGRPLRGGATAPSPASAVWTVVGSLWRLRALLLWQTQTRTDSLSPWQTLKLVIWGKVNKVKSAQYEAVVLVSSEYIYIPARFDPLILYTVQYI